MTNRLEEEKRRDREYLDYLYHVSEETHDMTEVHALIESMLAKAHAVGEAIERESLIKLFKQDIRTLLPGTQNTMNSHSGMVNFAANYAIEKIAARNTP